MARKKYIWKDQYDYQRVLEILEDYWVTEPTEEKVIVDMKFKRANGDTQQKTITWVNPEMQRSRGFEPLKTISFDKLMSESECDRCKKSVDNSRILKFPKDEFEDVFICVDCAKEMLRQREVINEMMARLRRR